MVLTRAAGGSSSGAAVTAIVPAAATAPIEPVAAPTAVATEATGAGPSQAPVTLDDMRGLLLGLEQKIRAEVRAEVSAAVIGKRPLSERAVKARVPEGFKWNKESHESRYLAQVKAVEPLEQLEALLEDFQAVDPVKGEEALNLLTLSTDRTYSIMTDYRLGDVHGWTVVNRLRGPDREASEEEQKQIKRVKKTLDDEAEEAERKKRRQRSAREEADRKRRFAGGGGGYGPDRRAPAYCRSCRREGHWPSECPNPPYRQSKQG